MNLDLKDLIKQATAAELRGVTPEAIGDLIRRKRLRHVIIDGVPHVFRSEVLKFQRKPPGPTPRRRAGK